MTDLPESIRREVRQRAGDRCEYCLSHQNYVMGRLQIDHLNPVAKGGLDTADNLCLACELCNQYKWTKTEGIDPQSGETVPLYNPRQQRWIEHFAWSANGIEIMGLTACGRATALALKLNNGLAATVRRNWVQAGWHPPTIE
jgi:HNH endonuclease